MYILVNQREIMPGARNLPNYLGLVKSQILREISNETLLDYHNP